MEGEPLIECEFTVPGSPPPPEVRGQLVALDIAGHRFDAQLLDWRVAGEDLVVRANMRVSDARRIGVPVPRYIGVASDVSLSTPRLSLVQRIVTSDGYRKSRLHDEKGNRVPLRELRHLPQTAWWAARRRLNGQLPELPWITFDAIRRLDQLLEPSWRMVEFGSGMSTAWYARRVAFVHSIESDVAWHARLTEPGEGLPSNVRAELRDATHYHYLTEYEDGELDFVVVDGEVRRDLCVEAAIPKIRAGGWLYLDNSDKDMTETGLGLRRAEQSLRDAVVARGGHLEQGTGLVVGQLMTQQWSLAQL